MATVKLRKAAQDCLGLGGTFRVRRDLFGYPFGGISRPLRVREHVERIQGKSINICSVLVGRGPDASTNAWTNTQEIRTQHAIDLMREIYAQADLGVRKIHWKQISPPDSDAYLSVDSGGATELTERYSCSEDGIDVFWVQTVSDAGGWSNSDGPCDKDDKGRTGAVLTIAGSDDGTGILLAHEVGHYLTLKHADTITNLMGTDSNGDGIGELNLTSRDITSAQRTKMHKSCWVRDEC